MIGYYCVEDPLSRAVLLKLICEIHGEAHLTELLPYQGGFSAIRTKFSNYCGLARTQTVFILTDLDAAECAPSLRADWMASAGLSEPLPVGMIFSVAVREVEGWLLADLANIGPFLGVASHLLPSDAEIHNPKQSLIECVRQHGNREAKTAILPNGRASVGLGYNDHLSRFVAYHWDFQAASRRSQSLERALQRIQDA
jgi:hypothetical protein